jgi:hypothetical protein
MANICGTVESRWSTSLYVREGSVSFLQGLNERLPWCDKGELFPVHVVGMELSFYHFVIDEFMARMSLS